ncbi:MAG: hypothetical protein EXS37_11640 [Opitutus sp.]|nr:hypothetical protein [Opitutus sp.]
MNIVRPLAVFVTIATTALSAATADLAALLARPIIDPGLPLAEVRAYAESRVPEMPAVMTLAAWEQFAQRTRREVLDKIVFRGDIARQWRDATTRIEWLDTISGGPGYTMRKLRYEALPGLWIPALLYQPDGVSGKIPVHLAVNGHDKDGKAAPYKQLRCINLAKRGIASLNVEWFNQGQLRSDGFVHYRMNQLDLCGVSGLAPFYLAMSRALDALLALPYADPKRVAVSGLSGGGWQTIIISSLDTRVALCNPVAGYSSYRTRAQFPSDLGDSEQTPNDLATVADYTHLTALLAGRSALITYNARDNCCFASDHALSPLLAAAEPIFQLYGQPERLRSHVNVDPGTHNFEVDNRQAFYRIVGETFFGGDSSFRAEEIPSIPELKTAAELNVPLPADNLDFHQLATAVSRDLPRTGAATRETLATLVHYQPLAVTAVSVGAETRARPPPLFGNSASPTRGPSLSSRSRVALLAAPRSSSPTAAANPPPPAPKHSSPPGNACSPSTRFSSANRKSRSAISSTPSSSPPPATDRLGSKRARSPPSRAGPAPSSKLRPSRWSRSARGAASSPSSPPRSNHARSVPCNKPTRCPACTTSSAWIGPSSKSPSSSASACWSLSIFPS